MRALEPFEKKQAYDGMYIQTKFDALLNSFIDKAVAGGRSVYTTSPLTGAVAAGYQKESLAVTLRLRRQMAPVTPLDLGELRLRSYEVPSAKIDFPARYMKRRIWSLLLMRGNQLEAAGQKANADRFFEEAAKLRE